MNTVAIEDRDIARWRFHNLHLTDPARSPEKVITDLLAVQAENHSQALWAVATRVGDLTEHDLGKVYDAGGFLRTHVLRSTWHYVSPDDIGWLLDVSRPRVRRIYEQHVEMLDLSPAEMEKSADLIVTNLDEDGPLTRAEVSERLDAAGFPSQGQHLMLFLANAEMEGLICSGPLVDGAHSYDLLSVRAPNTRQLDREEALAELALRYFTSHGPATERDLTYWATQTLTDVRTGLKAVSNELDSFEHDGKTYWHNGPQPEPTVEKPRAHLLQILDECYRGYQDSRWMIDADGIVPRNARTPIGMALMGTQIVATMRRQIRTSRVEFELSPYRALSADEMGLLDDEAAAYGRFLGLEPNIRLEG